MRPQTRTILSHLKSGQSINARQASHKYGIDRLAAHIGFIRKRGYDVATTLHRNSQNTGNFAIYSPVKMTLENE